MARSAAVIAILALVAACSGEEAEPGPAGGATRSFWMGSTPFFASATPAGEVLFPDWRFENLDDRDLVSLHVDDFWGVPWDYCDASGCSNLPPAWVAKWDGLIREAKATGKPLYLALSPLGDRRTLAPRVLDNGFPEAGWNAALDAQGCYRFADDSEALRYQGAYISYLRYLIERVGPRFLSPAVEINLPFTSCPAQKEAWIAWYGAVQAAVKAAYPQLVVFPTFQLEAMYGVTNAQAACSSGSLSACFDQRLAEALAMPADRIAFSTYPAAWGYSPEFGHSFPRDTFAKVAAATERTIWISETGWAAAPVLQSYAHSTGESCGAALYPSQLDVPGLGKVDLANDAAHALYLGWLLEQAQALRFETVVWWLNRDYLDGAVAETCPCAPAESATCIMSEQFHQAVGASAELLLRVFGNMALRRHDGSRRPGLATWLDYIARPHQDLDASQR